MDTLQSVHVSPDCIVQLEKSADGHVYVFYIIKADGSRSKLSPDGYWQPAFSLPSNGIKMRCRVSGGDGESLIAFSVNTTNTLVYYSSPRVQQGAVQKMSWAPLMTPNKATGALSKTPVFIQDVMIHASAQYYPYVIALVRDAVHNTVYALAYTAKDNYTTGRVLKIAPISQSDPSKPSGPTGKLDTYQASLDMVLSAIQPKSAAYFQSVNPQTHAIGGYVLLDDLTLN